MSICERSLFYIGVLCLVTSVAAEEQAVPTEEQLTFFCPCDGSKTLAFRRNLQVLRFIVPYSQSKQGDLVGVFKSCPSPV